MPALPDHRQWKELNRKPGVAAGATEQSLVFLGPVRPGVSGCFANP